MDVNPNRKLKDCINLAGISVCLCVFYVDSCMSRSGKNKIYDYKSNLAKEAAHTIFLN